MKHLSAHSGALGSLHQGLMLFFGCDFDNCPMEGSNGKISGSPSTSKILGCCVHLGSEALNLGVVCGGSLEFGLITSKETESPYLWRESLVYSKNRLLRPSEVTKLFNGPVTACGEYGGSCKGPGVSGSNPVV